MPNFSYFIQNIFLSKSNVGFETFYHMKPEKIIKINILFSVPLSLALAYFWIHALGLTFLND